MKITFLILTLTLSGCVSMWPDTSEQKIFTQTNGEW